MRHGGWGEVRSLVHQGGLTTLERASSLDAALHGSGFEQDEVLGRYILDHLPHWEPTSPELPYALIREWMQGELMELLGVLCSDRELVGLLGDCAQTWNQEYEVFVHSYYGRDKVEVPALSHGGLPLLLGGQFYERLRALSEPKSFFVVNGSPDPRLSFEEGEDLLVRVLAQEQMRTFESMNIFFSSVEGCLEGDNRLGPLYLAFHTDEMYLSYDLLDNLGDSNTGPSWHHSFVSLGFWVPVFHSFMSHRSRTRHLKNCEARRP